jgi:hypothetical protein
VPATHFCCGRQGSVLTWQGRPTSESTGLSADPAACRLQTPCRLGTVATAAPAHRQPTAATRRRTLCRPRWVVRGRCEAPSSTQKNSTAA